MKYMNINGEQYIRKSDHEKEIRRIEESKGKVLSELYDVRRELWNLRERIKNFLPFADDDLMEKIPNLTNEQIIELLEKYGIKYKTRIQMESKIYELSCENGSLKTRNKALSNRLNEGRLQYCKADINSIDKTIKLLQGMKQGMEYSLTKSNGSIDKNV